MPRALHGPADPWPALVLTAGLGTRLRPLSHVRAKPAMPVAGVPLASRILRHLSSHGIRDAVLNLHHLPHTVTAAVGDGSGIGVRVRYSWENPVLGSAGGPRRALPLLDRDRFFVLNGDTLTDIDLSALAEQHVSTNALVTMALVENPNRLRYGGVTVGREHEILGFSPAGPRNDGLHFIGAQVVETAVFNGLPADVRVESVSGVYADLIRARPGSVRAYVSGASFHDIGTTADYWQTNQIVAKAERRGHVPAGRGVRIGPGASVRDCVLWDDVEISEGTTLIDCVVADGVRVPPGSRFERCAIVRAGAMTPESADRVVGPLLIRSFDPWPS